MAQKFAHYPELQRTYYQGQTVPTTYEQTSVIQEGTTIEVQELDEVAPANGSESQVSGLPVTVRLIRNTNATTVDEGDVVKPGATGFLSTRTAGKADTVDEDVLGVVHHRLLSGIPQHDLGWVVIKGPCWVNKVVGALTVGDLVVASATDGSVQGFADTDTDDTTAAIVASARGIVGRVITSALSADARVHIMVGSE